MKSLFNISSLAFAAVCAMMLQGCLKEYDNPARGTEGTTISLYELKQLYSGSEVALNKAIAKGSSQITGVVISDKAANNIDASSFVLQESFATANAATDMVRGVVIKLASGTNSYNLGDSLTINIENAKMDRVNGKLTLTGIATDKITTVATGRTPLVRNVTQGILGVYIDQFESTLVAIHADVADYAPGTTFSGLRKLRDNTPGPDVYLHTRSDAAFAATQVPVNAQFTGIAGYLNESAKDTAGAKIIIAPRNAADVQFASGTIYAGFPESFESPEASTKASYNSGTNLITTPTGTWYLLQAILGNTIGSDKINVPGKQSIRMQQNLTTSGYVQMNFDVPNGASKVTVFYGRYGTDAKSSFRLEQSVNGGTTWTAVGANITDMPDKGMKQATWIVNVTGPVRFRINKLGIGTSNNGRLALDDFTIYKK